jgi:hypothetical protein
LIVLVEFHGKLLAGFACSSVPSSAKDTESATAQREVIRALDCLERVQRERGIVRDHGWTELSGVKVGEHVTARYYETVTIRSRKPGETVGLMSVTEAIPVANLGEPFRGGFTRELKIGASIEGIWQESRAADIQDGSRHEPSSRRRR